MYLKENVQKLKEIGLTDEEIRKIKKSKWLLEYCKPEDIFLLKLAYLVKTERRPAYEIIEGNLKSVERFETNFISLVNVFTFKCRSSAEEYMKTHFKSFLHIPKDRLDWCHFKTMVDSFLGSRYGSRNIYSLVDFKVHIFETSDLSLYTLYMNNCGVLWISKEQRVWIFAGLLTEENLESVIRGAEEFANKIFSSEWWQKLVEAVSLTESLGPSFKEYSEKVERLKEIKDWFDTLAEVAPAFHKIKKVPLDFVSQITTFYTQLLEEYLKM